MEAPGQLPSHKSGAGCREDTLCHLLKHLWGYRDNKNCMCGAATCDLNHIMTSCTHFGERPSRDDIAETKDGYVRWLRAIADTI